MTKFDPYQALSLFSIVQLKNATLADTIVTWVGRLAALIVAATILASLIFPGQVSLAGETQASTLVALCIFVYFLSFVIIGLRFAGEQTGATGFARQILNFVRLFLLCIILPAAILAILLTGVVFFLR